MALVKCQECGKEMSDKARVCPACGSPASIETHAHTEATVKTTSDTNNNEIVVPDFLTFKHPVTGQTKQLKVGFSWTLLFFAIYLIPLINRGLWVWVGINGALLFMWVSLWFIPTVWLFVNIAALVVEIYLGLKGNQLAAANYLEKGWKLVDSSNPGVKIALSRMGLSTVD